MRLPVDAVLEKNGLSIGISVLWAFTVVVLLVPRRVEDSLEKDLGAISTRTEWTADFLTIFDDLLVAWRVEYLLETSYVEVK